LAVHKLRALESMADPSAAISGHAANGANAQAEIEALGFVINAETHSALRTHSLTDLSAMKARSALVLSRETSLQEPRVAARLAELGVAVESAAVAGYARMIDDGAPPMAAWSRIVDFFVRESELRADAAIANEPEILQASRDVWDGSAAGAPIEETAGYFGPERRLFGVISHARTRGDGVPAPAVLLLSGGFNHHVGQNRMYTRWARGWAALGVTCLRFDLGGFGDSRVELGEADGALHSLSAIDDLRAAMDHLAAVGGSRRFAIVGLCSGAFVGFHAALADERVTSLALLNWTRFYPDATAPASRSQYRALRFYWAALTRRRTWEKLLRGGVDVRGVTKHFFRGVTRRLRTRLPLLAAGPTIPASRLGLDMRRLAQRGVKTLILYNGEDTAIDELHDQLGAEERRLRALGALRFEVLDGTDHIFTPTWSQDRLVALLTDHLIEVESIRPPPASAEVALNG
jgi:dienelactone hydrolase